MTQINYEYGAVAINFSSEGQRSRSTMPTVNRKIHAFQNTANCYVMTGML